MTTFLDTPPVSRKRKQGFGVDTKPSASGLSGWSDYLYTTSNPSGAVQAATDALLFDGHVSHAMDTYTNFCSDTLFSILDQDVSLHGHHGELAQPSLLASESSPNRHEATVSELGNHAHGTDKNVLDMYPADGSDMQGLLGLPSTWSPSASSSNSSHASLPDAEPMVKAGAPPPLSTTASHQHDHGPTTPDMLTPGFLDSLNADEKTASYMFSMVGNNNNSSNNSMAATINDHGAMGNGFLHDFMSMTSSPSASSMDYLLHHQQHQHQHHHYHHQAATSGSATGTIAPMSMTNDFQSLSSSSSPSTLGPWMHDATSTAPLRCADDHDATFAPTPPPLSPAHLSPTMVPSNTLRSSAAALPSPPVKPVQTAPRETSTFESKFFAQHQHPMIPEEDEEAMEDVKPVRTTELAWTDPAQRARASKSSLVTARMIQGAQSAMILQPHIRRYLLHPNPSSAGERTLMLLTSKVAQKSYGTEKRFLCPPPTTIMTDASWWTTDSKEDGTASPGNRAQRGYGTVAAPKLTIHISGEATSSQPGTLEWYTPNGTLLDGPTSAATATQAMTVGNLSLTGKCVSKQLHINDADEKRKRVEVLARIQLANGIPLGTFASKGIKVISKPSKKRQSVKNMDLCIHHGTTISLFNRIRSQTVSTKYLGVSGHATQGSSSTSQGTCFVARTGSWDPFVIWIVDTTARAQDVTPQTRHPTHPHYPPPPAIALQADSSLQPLAIHYNQAVVLQCVTTGLVSPVMVIRKVDKGSMVLGGNHVEDLSDATGGECGDEALGDPVSQLHKVAFQIVQDPSIAQSNKAIYRNQRFVSQPVPDVSTSDWTLPQSSQSITYLACLNDVVGMHKTTTPRTMVSSRPQPSIAQASTWLDSSMQHGLVHTHPPLSGVMSQKDGKVIRKRRLSYDVKAVPGSPKSQLASPLPRRRVSSVNDIPGLGARRGSTTGLAGAHRRGSADNQGSSASDGACWTEDVSDAAVWTIVGTDSATYTFWMPPTPVEGATVNNPFNADGPSDDPMLSAPITPFPLVGHTTQSTMDSGMDPKTLTLVGENLSRDLAVWFGDVKAPRTDYKSRESISCVVPELSNLLSSPTIVFDKHEKRQKLPILLVRGDGVVYRTGQFYVF